MMFYDLYKKMSVSVTVTKKFEIRNVQDNLKSNFEGISKSNFKAPFKIEIESQCQKSNCKHRIVNIIFKRSLTIQLESNLINRNGK